MVDQLTQGMGRDLQHRTAVVLLLVGKLGGGQSGQGETAAAGAHQHSLAVHLEADVRFRRQALGDVHQLAGRHRGFTGLVFAFQRQPRHQLQFQVGAGQGKLAVPHFHEHIGQNRQRLAFFDHRGNLL